MKARTKIALATAAVIASSALYGNLRFNSSRYEPQCEHLPGITLYGKTPQTSEISVARPSQAHTDMPPYYKEEVKIILRLLYSSPLQHEKWEIIEATYENRGRVPIRLVTSARAYGCRTKPPVQIVIGPFGEPVIKGSGDFEACYQGIAEIFSTPRPVVLDSYALPSLQKEHRKHFRRQARTEKEACSLYDTLSALLPKLRYYDQLRAWEAGRALANALEEHSDLTEETCRARMLIIELKTPSSQKPVKPFWRGWDVLFGMGFLGALVLGVSGIFGRKKGQKLTLPSAPEVEMEDETMKTEVKPEEFELTRKKYAAAIQNLADRVIKAGSFAELKELRKEYITLTDEIEAKGEKLANALGFNTGRLCEMFEERKEELGGPKARMP